MFWSEAFGRGSVKTRLRTESKSLPVTRRRKRRMQINVKLLLVVTKSPTHDKA